MDVRFRDSKTQRLFNEHDRMTTRYGAALARKAATRMEVLVAAPDLSMVPSEPPISCRQIGAADEDFTVDLDAAHRLRFVRIDVQPRPRRGKPRPITAIEVLGIECLQGDRDAWRPC